ncbi:unnamed protein product, partial [Bubo scandiacus]
MRAQLLIPAASTGEKKYKFRGQHLSGRILGPATELRVYGSTTPAAPNIPCRRFRGALEESALCCSSLPAASCPPAPHKRRPAFSPLSPAFTRRGRWLSGGEKGRGRGGGGNGRSLREQQVGGARVGAARRRPEPARAGAATCRLRALSSGAFGSQIQTITNKRAEQAGTRRGASERKRVLLVKTSSLKEPAGTTGCAGPLTQKNSNSSQASLAAFESPCHKPVEDSTRKRIKHTRPYAFGGCLFKPSALGKAHGETVCVVGVSGSRQLRTNYTVVGSVLAKL